MITEAAAIVASYLVGSIPVAVLLARAKGFDPREVGDKNPGYWNMKEQLGRSASIPVFVGDAAKGAAAGALGVVLVGGHWGWAYGCVAAAMVGHAFPVFARFRGGRSVLAFAGGMCVVAPVAAAVAIGALSVVTAVTRSFAYGARVAVFGLPVVQAFVDPIERVAATGALMSVIGLRFAMAALADRRSATEDAAQ